MLVVDLVEVGVVVDVHADGVELHAPRLVQRQQPHLRQEAHLALDIEKTPGIQRMVRLLIGARLETYHKMGKLDIIICGLNKY